MPVTDPQFGESEFSPPRSKQRIVPTPPDPPSEFRAKLNYPYDNEYNPNDAA